MRYLRNGWLLLCMGLLPWPVAAQTAFQSFEKSPHRYWERVPQDRFSKVMAQSPALDPSGELPLLMSLLKALEIPVSSQLLVYSATSLQSALINPRNPRAIYFNEDTSVGFVPGGRIEISSLDPEAGMVFFIFDRLSPSLGVPKFVRSERCMNCHADAPSKGLPGLVVDSVAVSLDGSSQETYLHDQQGHETPLEKRFGGWHLTSAGPLPKTHANLIGLFSDKGLITQPNLPGARFDLKRYPIPTSDLLPNLVHEHQVGFLNRVVEAIYLEREGDATRVAAWAEAMAAYVLFLKEAALPAGGIVGDPAFIKDFQAAASPAAKPLREFDLKQRVFRTPCSYLLLTSAWQMVPASLRTKVYPYLQKRLATNPVALQALAAGLPDWPKS